MDLKNQTPVQIDTQLADLWGQMARIDSKISFQRDEEKRAIKRGRDTTEILRKIEELRDQRDDLTAQTFPLNTEYNVRQWSRYYLVTSSDGHVHSNNWCSSVMGKTRYGLLVDYSGRAAEAVVEELGERACTDCFPGAPVHKPSMLPQDVRSREQKAAADAEKARKDADKEAKAIKINEKLENSYKDPATLISAQRELASQLGDAHRNDAYAKGMWERATEDPENNDPTEAGTYMARMQDSRNSHLRDAKVLARAIGIKTDRLPEEVFAEAAAKAAKKHGKEWKVEAPAAFTY